MRLSRKYLWVYIICLFTVAFLLILLSSLAQQKAYEASSFKEQFQAQQVFSEGVQKTLSNLTEENDWLKSEEESDRANIKQLILEKMDLDKQNSVIEQQLSNANGQIDTLDMLIQIQNLVNLKKTKDAKLLLAQIDPSKLSADAKVLFDGLTKKLK